MTFSGSDSQLEYQKSIKNNFIYSYFKAKIVSITVSRKTESGHAFKMSYKSDGDRFLVLALYTFILRY